jgi:hypothetical protein
LPLRVAGRIAKVAVRFCTAMKPSSSGSRTPLGCPTWVLVLVLLGMLVLVLALVMVVLVVVMVL